MADVLAPLDDASPSEFLQKAIATVPELENSANAASASLIFVVAFNGVMRLYNTAWTATVMIPKKTSFIKIILCVSYPPPLPAEGMLSVTVGSKPASLQIELYDMNWHYIYDAYDGPATLPIPAGPYQGNWKKRTPK